MLKEAMHYGIAISPGVVVAPAYCMDQVLGRSSPRPQNGEEIAAEIQRFDAACQAAALSLKELMEKTSAEIGERESFIFRAHLAMLRDKAFLSKVRARIVEDGRDATTALAEATAEYEALFGEIKDEYLRERIVDLRDVVARIQCHLDDAPTLRDLHFDEPVILVARELFPSQTINIDKVKISGIITVRGGATGHAAIIARSMGIPAVSGVADILDQVRTGDLVALDGREGCVIVKPGPEAESAFRKLQREFVDLRDYLIENREQPAITADGRPMDLLANINNVSDAGAAVEVGAAGIGLFRTEYLFMTHPTIPDEEEQYQYYKQILEASPNRRLTIRTLDLGGDKTVPYLGDHRESNPFMGFRSIRLSFSHPDCFKKQLRAILRVGALGSVQVLFPMISTVEELRRANRAVWRVKEELEHEGASFDSRLRTGFMLEVPAAAACLEHMVQHADFVTIGSNDLIQYLMAADRDNPRVAHLCDPLHPAVLKTLRRCIEVCGEAGKPVSVCGEMAGRPKSVLALLALGLNTLSMSPAFVPIVKELIHSVHQSDLTSIADDCLKKKTANQVRNFLNHALISINPRLAQLESRRQ